MKRKLHFLILMLLAGMGFLNAQNCYKTMSGPGVVVGTYLKTGGLCVTQLCLGSEYANLQNVIDDNIKSATSQGSLINILNNGGIAVRNNNTTYPGGYVAGFLFTSQNLIEIGLFNGFIVETYLNGKLQESKTLANILSANLLTAGIQNFYLTFPTTSPFNEVRFRTIGISATILSGIRIYSAFAFNPNDCKTTSVTACNRPISGINSQVSYDAPAVCALCTLTNAANINDGSSNNYATMYTTVSAVSSPSVGVLNTGAVYPAGYNAGFVVSPANGNALALVSVLNSISIETYLFGQLQERSTTFSAGGSGAFISIKILSYNGNLRSKIGFTTSKPFNEIRYKHNQLANVSIASTNVYYAYAEPGSCKDCKTYLGSSSSGKYSGALQSNVPGFFGLGGYTYNGTYGIALQSLNDLNNAISPSTTDYATYNGPFLAGLFAGSRVTVKNNGTQFPAGSTAGFIIQQNGSLLDLTVLNYITLRTYLINGSSVQLQEEKVQNGQLVGLDIIGGNTSKASIGFKTTKPFNAVQVDVSAGLATVGLGSSTYIYGAYAFEDADGDGYGDCEDTCPGGDDSMDSDGDGIPDDCDKCRAGNSSPELSGYNFTNVCPATGANLPDDAIVTVPNTVLEWHTVPEPTSAVTKISNAVRDNAPAGTYYAVFYDGQYKCYSPSTKVTVQNITCGIPDLTIQYEFGIGELNGYDPKKMGISIVNVGLVNSNATTINLRLLKGSTELTFAEYGFDPSLTSIKVLIRDTNYVTIPVNNANWKVTSNTEQQMVLSGTIPSLAPNARVTVGLEINNYQYLSNVQTYSIQAQIENAQGSGQQNLTNDLAQLPITIFPAANPLVSTAPEIPAITELNTLNTIKLYPNPANAYINITGVKAGQTIAIYNNMGQLVQNINVNNDVQNINLSKIATGTYILKVSNSDGTIEKTLKLNKVK